MKYLALGAAFACFLLLGCATLEQQPQPDNAAMPVARKCQMKCSIASRQGMGLSNGPCLGEVESDWVCDVAHSPRTPEDNLPENQCADFREGRSRHFVEVTPDCKLIRAV
jgi:hypothetical protein